MVIHEKETENWQGLKLGPEFEYFIVERRSWKPIACPDIVRDLPEYGVSIKPELGSGQLELTSPPTWALTKIEADLKRTLNTLLNALDQSKACLMPVALLEQSTLPLSDTRHANHLLNTFGADFAESAVQVASDQVNLGAENASQASLLFDRLRRALPFIMGLSACSPFRGRQSTLTASNRLDLYDQALERLKVSKGFPEPLRDVDTLAADERLDYQYMRTRFSRGVAAEIRCIDKQPTFEDSLSLLALVKAIALDALSDQPLDWPSQGLEASFNRARREGIADPTAARETLIHLIGRLDNAEQRYAEPLLRRVDTPWPERLIHWYEHDGADEIFRRLMLDKKKLSTPTQRLSQKCELAIVGGSVAGIAAAIALRQRGVHPTIFEQSINNNAKGLGFILMHNGMAALDRIGLGKETRALGITSFVAKVFNSRGDLLLEKTLPEHVCLMRSDFLDLLKSKIPSECFLSGQMCNQIHQSDDKIHLQFADGGVVESPWVILADGLHSRFQRVLFPEIKRIPVRVKELLCTLEDAQLANRLSGNLHKFQHPDGGLSVGIAVAGANRIIWYIQYDTTRYHVDENNLAVSAHDLVRDWADPIPEVLEKTDFRSAHVWRVHTQEPLPRFHKNRAVLIGDAAHALLTLISQGANAALVDAVRLADFTSLIGRGVTIDMDAYSASRMTAVLGHYQEGREKSAKFVEAIHIKE
ncbi:MAG: glutamate-cysteine ligase family protein [Gammaproteobacteria bacterium]